MSDDTRTYMEWSQKWVDHVCHYRNLAIALGAKPEDMLDDYDRKLCEDGIQTDDDYPAKNEATEAWELADQAEADRDKLRDAASWLLANRGHRGEQQAWKLLEDALGDSE